MKKLLLALVLTLSFQTLTKADDIKDFQIEEVSIGDSLLKHLNKNQIESSSYPIVLGSNEYKQYQKVALRKKSNRYEDVFLYYKTGELNNIVAVAGRNYFEDNIDECYSLQKTIVKELESILTKGKKDNKGKIKNSQFPDGDSYKYDISFYFTDGSLVHTACYDFSIKDTETRDRLSIGVYSKQYLEFVWSLKN